LSAIARFQPPWVKNAAWHLDGSTTVVEFDTDSDSGYHDFKDGTHVVLDILAPKTDVTAYAPPGVAKPSVTKLQQATAKVSSAQAASIADTAKQLQPAPAPESKAATAPPKPLIQPDADTKTAETKAAPALAAPDEASITQVAETKIAGDSAILNFKGANNHPSAVFVRGLTAWIVLEDAANLDPATLKAALASFANGIEASSSPGVSVLRITLKQPASITATPSACVTNAASSAKNGVLPRAMRNAATGPSCRGPTAGTRFWAGRCRRHCGWSASAWRPVSVLTCGGGRRSRPRPAFRCSTRRRRVSARFSANTSAPRRCRATG